MKCIIIADNFKKALSIVERATSKDITLPILGSFSITTEGGSLRVMGTNLEIGIQTLVRCTVNEQGGVVIPAKQLLSYISTLSKDEKITLESDGADISLTVQGQETTIKGYPQEDFPPFPVVKELYKAKIYKKDITQFFPRVLISVSKSAIKPELASVLGILEKETFLIASTDSFRLSEERLKLASVSIKNPKETFLLPARTFEEIIRLADQSSEDTVEFLISKGEGTFQFGDITLYSRLTEGNFPDYQQIIPKNFKTHGVATRQEIVSQLRRASIFANKLNSVSFSLNVKDKSITIESKNNQGTYKGVTKGEFDGEDVSIVFNFQYLLQGVESYAEEKLFFGFNSESQPLLIKPTGREGSMYIVMPMKGNV
ncbi:MAG: DNA polymerase III subunit beta [Patescibacteria group bacterium]